MLTDLAAFGCLFCGGIGVGNSLGRGFGLSAFALKIVAIVAMTCNHIAHGFESSLPPYLLTPFYAAGGLTFPIMAYLMIEGYHKTSDIKKYMLRLLFFGVLALLPFAMLFGMHLNVLFTFLLGLVCLYLHDNMKNKVLFWFCFAGIVLFTVFCDWSFVGVPMILLYGIIKNPKRSLVITTVGASLVMLLIIVLFNGQNALDIGFCIVILCVIPLLLAYNGERGYSPRPLRYMFYIYYPAHLLVIGGIAWLVYR